MGAETQHLLRASCSSSLGARDPQRNAAEGLRGRHFPAWVFKFCSIFSALNECFDLQCFQAPAASIDSGGLYGSSGLSCSIYMPKFGYLGWELRVLYSAWVCVSPAVGYGAKLGFVGKVFSKQGWL